MGRGSRARVWASIMNQLEEPIEALTDDVESEQISITSQADVLVARQKGREFALKLGFSRSHVTVIAAAICEIARNMVDYAQRGELNLSSVEDNHGRAGMLILARDEGPGIPDVDQALRYG